MKIARNRSNGQSLTYGFVHFKKEKDANVALAGENGASWNGKVIRVSYSRPKKNGLYCKIIISNVSLSLTLDEMRTQRKR